MYSFVCLLFMCGTHVFRHTSTWLDWLPNQDSHVSITVADVNHIILNKERNELQLQYIRQDVWRCIRGMRSDVLHEPPSYCVCAPWGHHDGVGLQTEHDHNILSPEMSVCVYPMRTPWWCWIADRSMIHRSLAVRSRKIPNDCRVTWRLYYALSTFDGFLEV